MDKKLEKKEIKNASAIVKPEDGEENLPVDLTVEEITFSMDHILEQIFSFLNAPDLLACRLVSHRFLQFARRPLKKRIIKCFFRTDTGSCDISDRTLAQLTEFLQQSSSLSASNPNLSFPCTSFEFMGVQLKDNVLQKLLNINGENIRRLKVCQGYEARSDRTHENIFMDLLCNLLTIQAPHLEFLFLTATLRVEWQQDIPNQGSTGPRSHKSPLLPTDPEYQEISSRVESLPRKSNLNELVFIGNGLAKTMEFLLQISPKLQHLCFHFNTVFRQYSLKPVNRMHLLKVLLFNPELPEEDDDSEEDTRRSFNMETMEEILQGNNLRLRELRICFRKALPACRVNREFENKVASMTSRLLEGSKDTLEHLRLSSFTFLWGMKMPTVLPKLRKIEIENDDIENESWPIFPKGFSWTETFPRLTSITIYHVPEIYDDGHFYDFFNRLDFGGVGNGPLSLGVKEVLFYFEVESHRDFVSATSIPASISERIHKLFPNANVGFADD